MTNSNFKPSDDRALWLDPRLLKVARKPDNPFFQGAPYDDSHYTYNPSAEFPVNQELMTSFDTVGWLGGDVEVVREGDDLVVEDGRQRVLAGAVLNDLREKKGEELFLVRVFVNKGGDELTSYRRTIGLNQIRQHKSPLHIAKEIEHLKNLGAKPKEIAVLYGWTHTDTVKNHLRVLKESPDPVKAALEKEEITFSDAVRMVHLPPEQQVKKLQAIPKKAPGKKRRTGKQGAKERGSRAGGRKPTNHQLTLLLDELKPGSKEHATLRLAMGLLKIRKAAEILGLKSDSPAYQAILAAEKRRAAEGGE